MNKQQDSIETFYHILEKWQEEKYAWLKEFLVQMSNDNSDLLPDLLRMFKELDGKYEEIQTHLEKFK